MSLSHGSRRALVGLRHAEIQSMDLCGLLPLNSSISVQSSINLVHLYLMGRLQQSPCKVTIQLLTQHIMIRISRSKYVICVRSSWTWLVDRATPRKGGVVSLPAVGSSAGSGTYNDLLA